ncbi:hypothetical protein HYV10_00585 [Candidatus Dependentiae bacterium]|nr:hypothetical protein [Candidatus Dependentiae bacterium]
MNNNQSFAEVIEGTLSNWIGQSWKWNNIPEFGSLVITKNNNVKAYGIVCNIQTGSNDPARKPMTYKKTEEELLRDQPQIFEFLQTKFTCIAVGYEQNDSIFYHIPSQPAKIHSFISQANDKEYKAFFSNNQFLNILFNQQSQILNFDELLLAIVKNLHEKKCLHKTNLHDFIETFSILSKNDYQKLKVFLHRMQSVMPNFQL